MVLPSVELRKLGDRENCQAKVGWIIATESESELWPFNHFPILFVQYKKLNIYIQTCRNRFSYISTDI